MSRGPQTTQMVIHRRYKTHSPREIRRQSKTWQWDWRVFEHGVRAVPLITTNFAWILGRILTVFTFHMALAAHQRALVEELMHLEDAHERLAAVVERARRYPRLPDDQRTPAHRIAGCSSSVWLSCDLREGRCHFRADADSPVVRGLVALLAEFFSDATPAEIVSTDSDPLTTLDLTRMLSLTRRNGLAAVRKAIVAFAADASGGARSS